MPLCQPIRNRRAKVFEGTANIGYVITKASIHDTKEAKEVIPSTHPEGRYILGNEGYIGKRLYEALKTNGYILWIPYRKNMKGTKQHNNRELMAIRRTIESVLVLRH
ncbi:hypothetical protein LDE03_15440 [Lactobacillus delbrueckii subsp. delbrueckii]|uniref:transposase n=1 Tax=Lactobacillus delbrueckii TaxID=1584 RepID=UPI0011637624|nr:hypothetical protein LDE01_16520 [Lactobacillus delbrueckii subsp. delbrueckii]GEA75736.1 hypothetical protein LDE03_15440 [Lactobacillus delbrueckii subsp. delbrueckii]